MLSIPSGLRTGHDELIRATQQVINAGANPDEVEKVLIELEKVYETPTMLQKERNIIYDGIESKQFVGISDEKTRIELQQPIPFEWWEDVLLNAAIVALPVFGPTLSFMVNSCRAIAVSCNVSIGIGPQVALGLMLGVTIGAGVCAISDGRFGGYGGLAGVIGAIGSVSANVQVTIVGGGLDRFSGGCWGAGIAGGEVIVGNAAALLGMTSPVEFRGITMGIGIGYGIPLETYINAQHTWALSSLQ